MKTIKGENYVVFVVRRETRGQPKIVRAFCYHGEDEDFRQTQGNVTRVIYSEGVDSVSDGTGKVTDWNKILARKSTERMRDNTVLRLIHSK